MRRLIYIRNGTSFITTGRSIHPSREACRHQRYIPSVTVVCCALILGSSVEKFEQMLGSYGPSPTGEPYIKNFDPDQSPSGMLARSGQYNVRSRVVDDDGEVYAGGSVFILSWLRISLIDGCRLGMGLQARKGVVVPLVHSDPMLCSINSSCIRNRNLIAYCYVDTVVNIIIRHR